MAAYFVFEQFAPNGLKHEFVIELTNAAKIAEARRIVADPSLNNKAHVQGTIVPGPALYNPDWSFHLDPESIDFFEIQMELCDANVTLVERNLSNIGTDFLPNKFWCPWSSHLIRELTSPPPRR